MIYTEHKSAESFLSVARTTLEQHECVNGLILGICMRLADDPGAYGSAPYLATVGSAEDLRVAAVMTPPRKLLLHAVEDVGEGTLSLVARGLTRGPWRVPGVMAPEPVATAFASGWCRQTVARRREGMRQRVYELRSVFHPTYPAGRFERATREHLGLARRWAHFFHEDIFGDDQHERSVRAAEGVLMRGDMFLWIDGVPRAMAGRTRPTPRGWAICHVYTPPEHRRQGYGTAVVAALSQNILDEGKEFCTLYTDLSNPTSNSIYRKIGYRAVADVIDIVFEGGESSAKAAPPPLISVA